jgi:hypothetical protein
LREHVARIGIGAGTRVGWPALLRLRSMFAALALSAPAALAQQANGFDASWSRVTGGGQTSSNGDFEVTGTVVPEADPNVAIAGDFSLQGGILDGMVQQVGNPSNDIFDSSYE